MNSVNLLKQLRKYTPLAGMLLYASGISALPGSAQELTRGPMPGFRFSPWFGEQVAEFRVPEGIRVLINAPSPARIVAAHPTLLVVYAAPNGNTLEQTMGCETAPGVDWHFDIQHVAAQIRCLRQVDKGENIIVACMEADGKSWPGWMQRHPAGGGQIKGLIDQMVRRLPGTTVNVALLAHSGGGSLLFGIINSVSGIPDYVQRIAFLDADYGFEDSDADRLKSWMDGDTDRRLVVVAYDDRNIKLDGKQVISPTGGTYRATHRMIDALKIKPAATAATGPFDIYDGFDGRATFEIHRNPDNKILHTALVGDMNGVLFALTRGTKNADAWGEFGGARAYTTWIQPAEFVSGTAIPTVKVNLPAYSPTAEPVVALLSGMIGKAPADSEAVFVREILGGNIPAFMRTFKTIHVMATDAAGHRHTADYDVSPDYLSIGSNADFVRVPLTPMSAEKIAEAFHCVLPTRKIVDDIFIHAEVRLDPIALTQDREALQTFVQHNGLIEVEREGKTPGLLVAGDKKDVVITNRLLERPNRVAIYGWHRQDGTPIQPLTIVHSESYVDYSHGIRLIRDTLQVDGKPMAYADVLKDPVLCILLSDEGPILSAIYKHSGD